MVNVNEITRQARHGLQTLSASDPYAQANMLRYVAACTQLLTGRAVGKALTGEPLVGAGFRLVDGGERVFASFTRCDGVERIYIAFDVDDAQGPPIGIGLFRKEGEHVVCYGLCKLWSPVGGGRALLVPTGGDGSSGYFTFRDGHAFRWVEGPVPGDFFAGLRRAHACLARQLAASHAEPVSRRGFATIVSNIGQTIVRRPLPLAA